MAKTKLPRLMLAAPASGSGKTTLTIALLQALKNRGLKPAVFKCGPDYIDPMFHREVLGAPGYNLDLFFSSPSVVRGLLAAKAQDCDADMAVLEGVMGYYDGAGMTDAGSSWHLSKETSTPTVLALRPGGASLSIAALIKGFIAFRENSQIEGILLNGVKVAMADRLASLIERECGTKVYGFFPNVPEAQIKSRHLGLVTPAEVLHLRESADKMGRQFAESVDVDALISLAATAPVIDAALPELQQVSKGVRIAVARDDAFCFYYQENLDLLETLGAKLVYFSALEDEDLPEKISGLYIGGGYPELHAKTLAENGRMKRSIRKAIGRGMPTIAECGGFLYLGQSLEDERGASYPMVGALPGEGFNRRKLERFGYVTLTANEDNMLCAACESIQGHEFHYWDSDCTGKAFTAKKPYSDRWWTCVQTKDNLYAGFPHLYFWSNPESATRFVKAADNYAVEQGI